MIYYDGDPITQLDRSALLEALMVAVQQYAKVDPTVQDVYIDPFANTN